MILIRKCVRPACRQAGIAAISFWFSKKPKDLATSETLVVTP